MVAEHIDPLATCDIGGGQSAGSLMGRIPLPRSSVRVYIAGPISMGDLAHNLNQATAAFVRLAKAGLAPLCPHWSAYSKPCYSIGDAMPGAVVAVGTAQGNYEMSYAEGRGRVKVWGRRA